MNICKNFHLHSLSDSSAMIVQTHQFINWLKISFYNDSGFATLEKIHCSNFLFRRGQNIIFWFLRSTLELLNVIALAISHRDFTFLYAEKKSNVTSLNFMPMRKCNFKLDQAELHTVESVVGVTKSFHDSSHEFCLSAFRALEQEWFFFNSSSSPFFSRRSTAIRLS